MARTSAAKRTPVLTPAELSQAPRVARFFARHLRHPMKGRWAGQPFVLEPWQVADIVEPIFGNVDPRTGLRIVSDADLWIARKNGKTGIASGIGLYGLVADGHWDPFTGAWHREWGAEVYAASPSKTQSALVLQPAAQMVEASPYLRAACKVYKNAIEVKETGSVFKVITSVGDLAHGFNPSMVIVDEFHAFRLAAHRELFNAMITATGAREQPLTLVISTAGYDRASIAHNLYSIKRRSKKRYRKAWEVPAGREGDPRAWKLANPASWITTKFIRDQQRKPGMHPAVWRRLHLNQWTGSEERWISVDEWDACKGKPSIPAGASIIVAVDAAPKRDSTAVVIVYRDPDGVHHVVPQVWTADRTMGYTDFIVLEDFLRELCKAYDVQRILVDPYAMARTMMVLAGEGLPIEEYPQSDAYMVPASQNLYDLVLERRLRHGGHKTLAEHSDNAAAVETARGWRLHKLKSTGHIDALVATAVACRVAEQEANDGGAPNLRIMEIGGDE